MISQHWRKSSHSGNQDCVEVRLNANGDVELRDSKNPRGHRLQFSREQWRAFLTEVSR